MKYYDAIVCVVNLRVCYCQLRTVLMKYYDAIVCVVNLRGGGEYGEEVRLAPHPTPYMPYTPHTSS
jgi:hypothetical protein